MIRRQGKFRFFGEVLEWWLSLQNENRVKASRYSLESLRRSRDI